MKKAYRVKKNEQFQEIIKKGTSKSNACFVMYYAPNQLEHDRVGISVGKKIGNAVERNKVKRQVRMMIGDLFSFKTGYDYVLIVRTNYNNFSFQENRMKLSNLYDSVYNKIRKDELIKKEKYDEKSIV